MQEAKKSAEILKRDIEQGYIGSAYLKLDHLIEDGYYELAQEVLIVAMNNLKLLLNEAIHHENDRVLEVILNAGVKPIFEVILGFLLITPH